MTRRADVVISGGRVVTPNGILEPGWVTIVGDRIDAVGGNEPIPTPIPPAVTRWDITGHWLVPGFVDVHCHGGGGAGFPEATRDRVLLAVDTHRGRGTTTMLASLVSGPLTQLCDQVSALAELVADGLVSGIHLEGPFLSVARRGAHDPAVLCSPDRESVAKLLRAGKGAIRMVTLAPELDGALDAIRWFTDAGVIVAIGHTNATEAQTRQAVDAGATVATHLFNAMPPLHHRNPGPVGALLTDERVFVELIADLVHLAPSVLAMAARCAGAGRTVLVTDAMAAAGLGDGRYELGGAPVTVRDGVATLDQTGSLAGSTLTLSTAVRNVVDSRGMSVTDAVAAAASTPATLLGSVLPRLDRIGVIETGAMADLVVLDHDLRTQRVMYRGRSMTGMPPT